MRERYCEIDVLLFEHHGLGHVSIAKDAMNRSLQLSGRIQGIPDSKDGPGISATDAPGFVGELIELDISSRPGDPDQIRGLQEGRDELSAPNAFGFAVTREEGGMGAWLNVSADAFEAIQTQVARAYERRRTLGATVRLIGKTLPEGDGVRVMIDALHFAKNQEYGVGGLHLYCTRYVGSPWRRGRVLRATQNQGQSHFTILITTAHYSLDVERGYAHSISCEGRIIYPRGQPYDGALVSVTFSKHETDEFDELPERAFFGTFDYAPPLPDEDEDKAFFGFQLCYVPEDAGGLLVPLFSQEAGTRIILTVTLASTNEELQATTERFGGNVENYGFEISRELVRDGD